jgi:hypothetical protein
MATPGLVQLLLSDVVLLLEPAMGYGKIFNRQTKFKKKTLKGKNWQNLFLIEKFA